MPQPFEERFAELIESDVGMLEIYYQVGDDFRMDHPECPVRFASMLTRGAINRSHITQMIRKEMEYYYRTGEWRKTE